MAERPNLFLSCSALPADQKVFNFFKAICEGLGFHCVNVATSHSELPPEVAQQMITEADAFVAVATRRGEEKSGEFDMSSSVTEEIVMARTIGRKCRLFREEGVRLDGFKNNYGTWKSFDRTDLRKDKLLKDCIEALVSLHRDISDLKGHSSWPSTTDYYVDDMNVLNELVCIDGKFIWKTSTTKKIKYSVDSASPIIASFWCEWQRGRQDGDSKLDYSVTLHRQRCSRPFEMHKKVIGHSANDVELQLTFSPTPVAGDVIEYTAQCSSSGIAPIFGEEIDPKWLEIGGKSYPAFDGFVCIVQTRRLHVVFKFPGEYLLTEHDIHHIVGAYASRLTGPDMSQMDKIKPKIHRFGNQIIAELEVHNPLLLHLYGFAWAPKPKDEIMQGIETANKGHTIAE